MNEKLVNEIMEQVRQGEIEHTEAVEALSEHYLSLPKKQRLPVIVAIRNYPAPEGSDAFSWLRKKNNVANVLSELVDEQKP